MQVEGGADAAATAAAAAAAATPAPAAEGAAPKPKRKFKPVRTLEVVATPGASLGMSEAAVKEALAAEREMVARDHEIHATQDMRNSLEALIYSTRGALDDALQAFTTEPERKRLGDLLTELEEWLYNDGFSVAKAVYKGKLDDLSGAAEPLVSRKAEAEGRYGAVTELKERIEHFRGVLDNRTGKHAHLGEADKDSLRAAVNGAERWLAEASAAQATKERYEAPVLRLADLAARRDALEKECGVIERRPVPAPPAPVEKMVEEDAAAAAAAAAPAESKSAEGAAEAAAMPEDKA